MRPPEALISDESLSSRTTLRLGGPAAYFLPLERIDQLLPALRWAHEAGLPVRFLGGGSNLVVSDGSLEGLVIHPEFKELQWIEKGEDTLVEAGAGIALDRLVEECIGRQLWGLENLSGIPGSLGGAVVLNAGAYGVEIGDVLEWVDVVEVPEGNSLRLEKERCGLRYRGSLFRDRPGRYLITQVGLRLRKGPHPRLEYTTLRETLENRTDLTPADVRRAVCDIRAGKGMLLDPAAPGSAGSFFLNPVLRQEEFDRIREEINRRGIPVRKILDQLYKLPAAALIEETGFTKGLRREHVGISVDHALALVHHGGGTTVELLGLARDIRDGVAAQFGIRLDPEPVFWGFDTADPLGEGR